MNVFQMYEACGNSAGFWIQRDSWGATLARVVSIAGRARGPLTGLGKSPYYDKARDAVLAELYRVRQDRAAGRLILTRFEPRFSVSTDDPGLAVVSCPGTFAYRLVDLPASAVVVL